MRAFKFNLETILTLRKHEEDSVKYEMAGVNRRFERERGMMERLKKGLLEGLSSVTSRGGESRSEEWLDAGRYIESHNKSIQSQEKKLKVLEAEMEGMRVRLREAARRRRLLELLREKKLKEYRKESAKAEQDVQDEAGGRAGTLKQEAEQ